MLYALLRLFSICLTGASAAVILVAKYVYAPMLRGDDGEDEPLPFEWRFLEELEALPARELSPDERSKLAEQEVDVETPAGRVLMSYDDDSKSFAYHTDSKRVPFRYLDAVARQFAVEHDAKQICVNYGYDYVAHESTPSPGAERSSVFVKLKARPAEAKRRIKIMNRFSHRGSIEQKWTVLEPPNAMTFADYKKMR